MKQLIATLEHRGDIYEAPVTAIYWDEDGDIESVMCRCRTVMDDGKKTMVLLF